MRLIFSAFIMFAGLSLSAAFSVDAATLTVTNAADSGPGSLRQAVASAISGDTIDFDLTYPAVITLTTGEILIDKDLIINGPGARKLEIRGDAIGFLGAIFLVKPSNCPPITVTISGLTINNTNSNGNLELNTRSGAATVHSGSCNSTLTISDCLITGNSSSASGVMNWFATLIVRNSTFTGLGADAAYAYTAGTTIINSTFSKNFGFRILQINGSNIINSTIANNNAENALWFEEQPNYIKNSIFANNQRIGNENSQCRAGATIVSLGGNIIDDLSACNFNHSTDRTSTNPGLSANGLVDNGGETDTIALAAGAAAVDAVAISPTDYCTLTDGTTSIAFDQRGIARPQSSACDSGAFEGIEQAKGDLKPIIDYYNKALVDKTIIGVGPGKSGKNRPTALRNQLLAAGAYIESDNLEAACSQLAASINRIHVGGGIIRPYIFVSGTNAGILVRMLNDLRLDLSC